VTRKRRREPLPLWWIVTVSALAVVVLALGASFVWRLMHPPVTPFVDAESDGPPVVIQINVVNASGVRGAARRAMEFLRERGFDVVELSTAADTLRHTVVIDRVGDVSSARKVASVIGVEEQRVSSSIDSMLFVHASVVLGADVGALDAFQP